nr:putative lipoate-protein ligase A isoform X2 [Ipomoea trifida]GMC60738.1 putative lipoate-protein ligase A isoform X2 [Ipomoea batatas]
MSLGQPRNVGLPLLNLVKLKGVPILQQLHLEERLLRTSSDNWCIINDGTNTPTIVMGISGVQPYPRPIMSWSSLLYSKVFQGVGDFYLRENGTVLETVEHLVEEQSLDPLSFEK